MEITEGADIGGFSEPIPRKGTETLEL